MKEYLERSYSFSEYVRLLDDLLADGKTTGFTQSDAMLNYAKLNRQRMKRLEKTVELDEPVKNAARSVGRKMIWLIITEGWCGDAAQIIPVIEKIASQSQNVVTRYVLRDENPALIDQFLTNGARSIPKLIVLDAVTLEVLASWGPRPVAAQETYEELRSSGEAKPLIMENLQRWYNNDAARSIQLEFEELISALNAGEVLASDGV
jgi:hypothetical protein